jgi:hypothetical protein
MEQLLKKCSDHINDRNLEPLSQKTVDIEFVYVPEEGHEDGIYLISKDKEFLSGIEFCLLKSYRIHNSQPRNLKRKNEIVKLGGDYFLFIEKNLITNFTFVPYQTIVDDINANLVNNNGPKIKIEKLKIVKPQDLERIPEVKPQGLEKIPEVERQDLEMTFVQKLLKNPSADYKEIQSIITNLRKDLNKSNLFFCFASNNLKEKQEIKEFLTQLEETNSMQDIYKIANNNNFTCINKRLKKLAYYLDNPEVRELRAHANKLMKSTSESGRAKAAVIHQELNALLQFDKKDSTKKALEAIAEKIEKKEAGNTCILALRRGFFKSIKTLNLIQDAVKKLTKSLGKA